MQCDKYLSCVTRFKYRLYYPVLFISTSTLPVTWFITQVISPIVFALLVLPTHHLGLESGQLERHLVRHRELVLKSGHNNNVIKHTYLHLFLGSSVFLVI